MEYNFPNLLSVFYKKIYKVVDDPSSDPIISWSKSNVNGFVIWNLEELIRSKTLNRFNCSNFSEFHSELKYYGFRRIKKNGSGELEYGNKDFVRDHPERLRNMMHRACLKNKAKFLAKEAAKKASKKAAKEAAKEAADRLKNLQV